MCRQRVNEICGPRQTDLLWVIAHCPAHELLLLLGQAHGQVLFDGQGGSLALVLGWSIGGRLVLSIAIGCLCLALGSLLLLLLIIAGALLLSVALAAWRRAFVL